MTTKQRYMDLREWAAELDRQAEAAERGKQEQAPVDHAFQSPDLSTLRDQLAAVDREQHMRSEKNKCIREWLVGLCIFLACCAVTAVAVVGGALIIWWIFVDGMGW